VKKLFDGPTQWSLGQVELSSSTLAGGQGSVEIKLPGVMNGGATKVSWDGTTNNGQLVDTGTYYFKVENTDPFGHTKVTTRDIPVVKAVGDNSLGLYNSAGEMVAQIPLGAYPDPITDFSLDQPSFAPAYDPATGQVSNPLKINLVDSKGTSHTFLWDGRNGRAKTLASGNYTLRLLSDSGSGSRAVVMRELVMLKGTEENLPEVVVAPNPATRDDREIFVEYKAGLGIKVKAGLYNVAGELIGHGRESGPNALSLDVSRLATGVYVVVFEAQDENDGFRKKIVKVAVVK
jgi:hypothetical protein